MRKRECLRVYANSSATCRAVRQYICAHIRWLWHHRAVQCILNYGSTCFLDWRKSALSICPICVQLRLGVCAHSCCLHFCISSVGFISFTWKIQRNLNLILKFWAHKADNIFSIYIIIVWSYGSRGLVYILFAFPLWQNAIEPSRFRFETLPTRKKQFFIRKGKKKRNNWFIPQIDAIPHCFSKVGKKHGSRVSFWHIWKSSQFRLNLSLPFCTNLFTQTHFHSFFSLVTNFYRTAWVCDILFKEFQSNGKKGIMSDEMDECACYWSHEFAMRRLLALVSIGIWIFCLIRWLMEKLIIIFSLPHFIVETRTGLLHWQWMHRS